MNDALKATPIIGLSAHAMSTHENMAIDSGCTAYLTKPINDAILFKTLEMYLS
jgi:CheY-like chemotaxis protein